jgi:putative transposase
MEYKRDEHRVHRIVYHLTWCPKRGKAVLAGDIARDYETLVRGKCLVRGWDILSLQIQPGSVQVSIQVFPSDSAAEVVKELKGCAASQLRNNYPELLKLPSLWTRSYLAVTVGSLSPETILHYIDAQKGI